MRIILIKKNELIIKSGSSYKNFILGYVQKTNARFEVFHFFEVYSICLLLDD